MNALLYMPTAGRARRKSRAALSVALIIIAAPLSALGRPLTPEKFIVDSGSYRYWIFEIPRSARVSGQFRVQEYDINVFLVDESEFENFRNGKSFRSYYSPGRVSAGQINLRLYSGRYVIIFDNTFWLHSNKTITSTIQLDDD